MIARFAMAGVAAIALTAAASADVLYDNFGPGDSYNTGSGWTIGSDPGNWVPASAITIGGSDDFFLKSITAAISFVQGQNGVTLTVYADSGGLPGAAIETSSGNNFGNFGQQVPVTKFDFSGSSVLSAGGTYWIGFATLNGPNSWLVWNFNDQNANLPRAFQNNNTGGMWESAGTTTAGAMRVEGNIVPAPGALALLGLAGLAARRRRRTR